MRAIIYIRVSSTQQEDGASLDVQEAQCRTYCASHGYQIISVLRDTKSGVHLWDRPEMTKLRQAMASNACDVVVFWDVSRWAREPGHLVILRSEARYFKVQLACVSEELGDSDEDDLVYYAKGYAAKQEWKAIRRRTVEGRKARAQKGYILAGRKARFGYRYADAIEGGKVIQRAKYEIDPDTGPVVERIFAEALKGKTLRQIAADLTTDGIPTPMGKYAPWNFTMVSRTLKYPNYAGHAVGWAWRKNETGSMVFNPDNGIALAEDAIPALVSPEVYQAVQAMLANNKAASRRNAKHPEAALLRGGFARCGYCGAALTPLIRSKGTAYSYACNRNKIRKGLCKYFSISTALLDEAVCQKIRSLKGREGVILKELERMREQDPTGQNLKSLDRAIGEMETKLANLMESLSEITVKAARALMQRQINELGKRLEDLEEQKAHLIEQNREWDEAQKQALRLQKELSAGLEAFDDLSYDEKRTFLTAWRVQAIVWATDHDPRFKVFINPPVFLTTSNSELNVTLMWTDKEMYA